MNQRRKEIIAEDAAVRYNYAHGVENPYGTIRCRDRQITTTSRQRQLIRWNLPRSWREVLQALDMGWSA